MRLEEEKRQERRPRSWKRRGGGDSYRAGWYSSKNKE